MNDEEIAEKMQEIYNEEYEKSNSKDRVLVINNAAIRLYKQAERTGYSNGVEDGFARAREINKTEVDEARAEGAKGEREKIGDKKLIQDRRNIIAIKDAYMEGKNKERTRLLGRIREKLTKLKEIDARNAEIVKSDVGITVCSALTRRVQAIEETIDVLAEAGEKKE